ncbi:uncharacterized protein LOC108853976 [Raphanus sativus]|uniref:Uncharacterized protein LOC108853976 n=1 Tax=Raphanus sativus TaxID=3726 RepID=A0A6J0NDZ3_RAPSA|nr:uncharacterized protein LOC108853976 [Raphanus sativus]
MDMSELRTLLVEMQTATQASIQQGDTITTALAAVTERLAALTTALTTRLDLNAQPAQHLPPPQRHQQHQHQRPIVTTINEESADEAVFPCVLKILPNCVFNKRDPIVLGVDVVEGILKIGTPICVPSREFVDIGRIASIENNHKPVDYAKKGTQVAIKIIASNPEEQKMFGRHFDMEDELVSHISRKSIDILKTNYRDELNMDEWKLVVKLKNIFKIQ